MRRARKVIRTYRLAPHKRYAPKTVWIGEDGRAWYGVEGLEAYYNWRYGNGLPPANAQWPKRGLYRGRAWPFFWRVKVEIEVASAFVTYGCIEIDRREVTRGLEAAER